MNTVELTTIVQTIHKHADYWLTRVERIVCTEALPIFTWVFHALEDEVQGIECVRTAEEAPAVPLKERLTTYRSAAIYWESAIIGWTQAIVSALETGDNESINYAIQARRQLAVCLLTVAQSRLSLIEQDSFCPPQFGAPSLQQDSVCEARSGADTLVKTCQPVSFTSWVHYARTQSLTGSTMHVIKAVLEASQHEQEGNNAFAKCSHASEQALAFPFARQAAHWHSALRGANQALQEYEEALKCWHVVICELTSGELSQEITYADGNFAQPKPTTHPYLAEAIARRNALYSQIHEVSCSQAAAYRRCQPIQNL